MDFFIRRNICKDFLDKYNEKIYPELLSRIIEIGILTLKLSFNKLAFTQKELDDIIYSLHEQSKIEQNFYKLKHPKKLTNKKFNQENQEKEKKEQENNLRYNTICLNNRIYDKIHINNTNFYDLNYLVPKNKTYRNEQLYQKRLDNPLFPTLNKNIYPFWWWNFSDSDEEESYFNFDNNNKSQKSFNNYNSSKNSEYDETKIFQRSGFNNNYYNYSCKESSGNNNGYFNNSNYKMSFDRNLNIIGVEKGGNKRKSNIRSISK